MINYGIELEFFVKKEGKFIPAYEVTNNTDGNPVIGEIKTGIHNNITDCIFELKKLLYLEESKLKNKGCELVLCNEIKVDNDFLKSLRKDKTYINRKELEVLEEFSIYGANTGKILPRGSYKASLQVNISDNKFITTQEYYKITIEDKYKYESKCVEKGYSGVFNYVDIIRKLDNHFKGIISSTNRVKGVYAIKEGQLGSRVEYRSLPNTIKLDELLEILK